jgi:hypothetical protein
MKCLFNSKLEKEIEEDKANRRLFLQISGKKVTTHSTPFTY